MNQDYIKINEIFNRKNIVVITGAGISVLSGLSSFRGTNGLYTKNINAEEILSLGFFKKNPSEFYNFYKENMIISNYKPNIIHEALAELEEAGNINCIITQNIDNLHQKAGSKNVINLHGNGEEFYCVDCHTKYDTTFYLNNGYICPKCNAIIRPNIVLYDENILTSDNWKSNYELSKADVLIVLGSSLLVSTAANLVKSYLHQKQLSKKLEGSFYIINRDETPFDYYSPTKNCDLEEVFQKVFKR